MPTNAIGVQILGDPSSLIRSFKKSEVAATQFAGRMQAVNQASRGALAGSGFNKGALLFGSGSFVAAAVATAAIEKSVTAASDLNEQISKNNAVFQESSDIVQDWSRTTAAAIGVSRSAALEATGTFGNLFNTVGLAPSAAAEMSTALVGLAADLASFNNADISDVLLAIRSGLIGEAEPLRRYGVLLSETRVQQEALAETGKSSVKQLSDQEKALARYNIILRDTVPAQGDFERTSGGLANQTRILRANLDDLAANIGTVLLPEITAATEAANLLFAALKKFQGQDFTPGFDFPEIPDFLKKSALLAPISPLGAVAIGVKGALGDDDKNTASIGDQIAASASGAIAKLTEALEKRRKALLKAQKAADARELKQFNTFLKGLGLKLDKAGISASLADDIAALREIEDAIQARIRTEGRTFDLVQQLTDVRQQIANAVARQAEQKTQDARDAYSATLDALNLRLDIASATRGFQDDMGALRAIEDQIRARIAQEGETTELARQLFENRQQQADVARQARNATQFGKLGLTDTGEKVTPSVGALKKRLGTLRNDLKGTVLDTAKTRSELQSIAKVLSGAFGTVGKEVRAAILQMFDDISSALDDDTKIHSLTKTTSINTKKILDGLDLTAEQERALRARLSNFNSGGQGLANAQEVGSSGGTFVVEAHTTVNLDGQKVASNTTKHQQKAKRRNPQQKRGPHRR